MKKLITASALLLISTCGLFAQPSPPPDPSKIQVLLLTGQHVHPWKETTPVLKQILEDTKKFEVRISEEPRGLGPETLANYDLVVINYYNRGDKERWGERAEAALQSFVGSGKGLVVYHLALGAFDGWKEFEKMSGGNWRPNNGHHSARHDFTVDVKDEDHPITKGLKSSFPMLRDELYANLRWQPDGTYRVLATAWDDHSLYAGRARQPIPGAGIHQPILWTTEYGKGRVFNTALGHDGENVKQLPFGVTFARGAEWAAKGVVTLPIPAEIAK